MTTPRIESIQLTNPRPTSTGVRDGLDFDVTCLLVEDRDGAEVAGKVSGEITVAPDHTGTLAPYGNTGDMWISGKLLRTLESVTGDALGPFARAVESAL